MAADIIIKNESNSIVWRVPVRKLSANMKVSVEDGCVALCCVNGTVVNEFYSTDDKLMNEGNQLAKRFGKKAEVCFYVFNNSKPIEVRWGIGKTPVSYTDSRINGLTLAVTAYGNCKINVSDAKALMHKMPAEAVSDNAISADEISSYVQKEIIAKVAPVMGAELNKIGDYSQIRNRISSIADAVTNGIQFMEFNGLRVNSTLIESIDFTDESREIIDKFEKGLLEPLNTKVAEEQAKQIRVMVDAVSGGKKEE